jgi:hypothetical protein
MHDAIFRPHRRRILQLGALGAIGSLLAPAAMLEVLAANDPPSGRNRAPHPAEGTEWYSPWIEASVISTRQAC